MKIIDRMTLLLRADAHGVMDQLEERSLLLRQHLRDAEDALAARRAEVEALAREEQQLRGELDRRAAELRRLDEDVELALSGGKDELARFAIRRLLPGREARAALEVRLGEVAETRAALAVAVRDQETCFEDLKRRTRARLAEIDARDRHEADELGVRLASAARDVTDQEVELELLRRRRPTAGEVA